MSGAISDRTVAWEVDSPLIGRRRVHGLTRPGPLVAVLSSRLSNRTPTRDLWLRQLRSFIGRLDQELLEPVTAPRTTCDAIWRARDAGESSVRIIISPPPELPMAQWEKRFSSLASPEKLWVSPCLAPDSQNYRSIPLRDRLLFAFSRIVFIPHVREGGHLDQLLALACDEGLFKDKQVIVAAEPQLVSPDLAQRYIDAGALSWSPSEEVMSASSKSLDSNTIAPIVPLPTHRPYLLHWTRTRQWRLPNESIDSYLDQLIAETQYESPLATLLQILESGRLIGSAFNNREQTPVVCFTGRSLEEFHTLRRYRPHLRRWDFEPYGIGVAREALMAVGGRPVIYGNDFDWLRLGARDRPWFQPRYGESSRIDWSFENEWRVEGDLDLARMPRGGLFVYVPTQHAANIIACRSRWPIVIAPNSTG